MTKTPNEPTTLVSLMRDMEISRQLGMEIIARLDASLKKTPTDEEKSWIWGEKSNAANLWVQLSGHLSKMVDHEHRMILSEEKPAAETSPEDGLDAQDQALLARYMQRLTQEQRHEDHQTPDRPADPGAPPRGGDRLLAGGS